MIKGQDIHPGLVGIRNRILNRRAQKNLLRNRRRRRRVGEILVSDRVRSGVRLAFGLAATVRGRGGAFGVLAGTPADGDVPKGSAFGPITSAALAEMAGLS